MNDEKPEMIRVYPKPNCPRCYGRGYIGHDSQGKRIDCSCLVRPKAHIPPKGAKVEAGDG